MGESKRQHEGDMRKKSASMLSTDKRGAHKRTCRNVDLHKA